MYEDLILSINENTKSEKVAFNFGQKLNVRCIYWGELKIGLWSSCIYVCAKYYGGMYQAQENIYQFKIGVSQELSQHLDHGTQESTHQNG